MIKEITIKNFKSIKDTHLSFSQINLMVGLNGAGKTNLIRAISLVQNLAMGFSLEDSTKELMIVPSELFFQQNVSTEIFISIEVASDENCYLFELVIENNNDIRQVGKLPLKIKQEKLSEYTEGNRHQKKIVYRRESGNLVKNEEEQNIPIEVASNQTVSGIYKHPSIVVFREVIKSITFINTDTISSSKQSRFVRYDDPTNLTSLIVRLKHENEQKFKMFENTLKKLLPSLSNITDFSAGESAENNKLFLVLFEQLKLAGRLSFKSLSDGDIRTLMIILNVVLLEKNSTLVLEEIENALHPHRVKLIVEYLKRTSYSSNVQLIFTTHSPLIIDSISPEEVTYVQRKNGLGSQFVQFKDSEYTSKIQRVLKEGGSLTDFMESMLA